MSGADDRADIADVVHANDGWEGPVVIRVSDDDHVHVEWNGRHVEALSLEAAAEFIRADARAKAGLPTYTEMHTEGDDE
jgi:hypothetical protein